MALLEEKKSSSSVPGRCDSGHLEEEVSSPRQLLSADSTGI